MSDAALRGAFATAADVARHAGVSRSAVSRTFTPGASVSHEARARVLEAADRLGYRVNRLAQSLNKARSNVIGLVGTELSQPFHAALLGTLPRRQRAVLVLRFYEGRSDEEIAAILGCAPGTVRSHVSRALAGLRELVHERPITVEVSES